MNRKKPKLLGLIKKMGEGISQAIEESKSIPPIIKALKDEGFSTNISLQVSLGLCEIESSLPLFPDPQPLVQNDGSITPDAFGAEDKKFLKEMGIELDDPPE